MFRTLMCLVLALIVAAPLSACVPQASNETPNGADSGNASNIVPVNSSSGTEVTARPKQIPGSMGGGADISNTGATNNSAAAGDGVKTPVTVSGGSTGVAPDGSTVTTNGDGTKTVTVPQGKEAKIKGGIFDDGKEARDGAQGTLTNGGTILVKDAKPKDGGGFDLEDVKKVTPGPNSGVRTSGGQPLPTGATTGVTVENDENQDDVNQKYADTRPKP